MSATRDKPQRFWNRLYWQLALWYLVLLFIFCTGYAVVFVLLSKSIADRSLQLDNWDLAQTVADRLAPHTKGTFDVAAALQVLEETGKLTPTFDIFIVRPDGSLFSFDAGPTSRPQRISDLAVLQAAIEETRWSPPLRTIAHPETRDRVPFSVARLPLLDEPGYLLIALRRHSYSPISVFYWSEGGLRQGSLLLIAAYLLAAVIGVVLFIRLTRHFYHLVEVVRRYRQGDYAARVTIQRRNEIGELGEAINEMADEIQSNIEQLQRKDALRRELVANVSHDLRAPVTSINALAETLIEQRDHLSAEEYERCLQSIIVSGESLALLVKELFDLSKLEAGDVVAAIEDCPLAAVVEKALMRFSAKADAEGIELVAETPEELPPVRADAKLLGRVLDNLISNAIKFTPAGGRITVRVAAREEAVTVAVCDTGAGIDQSALSKIFDRSYRAASGKAFDGMGLGLAIVAKLLELHGAAIRVESASGEGTIFYFDLPRADV